MAKVNKKRADPDSPVIASHSDSEEDSYLFGFFSSSSSFISSASLSENDLWSETSFSFSSEDAPQQNDDKISEKNEIKSSVVSDNNKETKTHFKFSCSLKGNTKDEKCFKLNVSENNSLQNKLDNSHPKKTHKSEVIESCTIREKLDFSYTEVSNNDSNKFSCDICGNNFNSQATLDVHKLNHLVSETYICEICEHASKNREDYILHFRLHTGNCLEFSGNSMKKKKFPFVPYRCDTCGKAFRFSSSFKRHLEKHTLSHICNICNASFPTQLLCHQHKLQHVKMKVHKCEECGKIFQRPHQLTIHMQVHKNDKKYHCKECDTTYCYKTSLMRHALKYHSPDSQKFQCDVCGELFKTKKMLNGHVILHTAKKLIQCPDCSQTFKYRSSYHRHRIIHQGSKPFRCSTCGKLFKTESHLKIHKAQHVINDEFVCNICDKSFGFRSFLDQHMLMHEDKCSKNNSTDQSD
ncbi:Zinc finger protein 90 [Araneus ventricosus]|uniref:Zinc finger protein 90 n=1 Tax=Araneus ventricosus TaxID=182803 RepID=A0A4Y2JKZ2_ARAVE|nr:Zinc finger protein 90 [Araneus ventricosus]